MAEINPHIEQFMSAAMKSYLNSLAETSWKQYIANFGKFSNWMESQTEENELVTFEVDDLKDLIILSKCTKTVWWSGAQLNVTVNFAIPNPDIAK